MKWLLSYVLTWSWMSIKVRVFVSFECGGNFLSSFSSSILYPFYFSTQYKEVTKYLHYVTNSNAKLNVYFISIPANINYRKYSYYFVIYFLVKYFCIHQYFVPWRSRGIFVINSVKLDGRALTCHSHCELRICILGSSNCSWRRRKRKKGDAAFVTLLYIFLCILYNGNYLSIKRVVMMLL